MTVSLTVTAKGQVTLRKEVLEHLRIGPGDKLDVDLLPDGELRIKAAPGRPVESIFGLLARPGLRRLTLREMDAAITDHQVAAYLRIS